MKRKLNEEDVPAAVEPGDTLTNSSTFNTFGLDSRLLQAVAKENFLHPTNVQAKAIPLALEGKDILARSKTGSGKTAAYVLPILHSILRTKTENKKIRTPSALILVPTRELAQQISKVVSKFSAYCARDIRVVNLTQKVPDSVQRALLADSPDIVIATPGRSAQNLASASLSLEDLSHLVIDEADLVLSYGYDDDLQAIAKAVPQGVQTFLMSATLSTEVNSVKGLFCRDPVIIDIQETVDDAGDTSQFIVKCAEDEKFLLAYVIFKLKLIKGKCIIFVGDIDRCYRLKLFFEQFGIRSCVLNSELPINSRIHVVEEFNKNVYDIIIASDEHEALDISHRKQPEEAQVDEHGLDESPTTVNLPNNESSSAPIDSVIRDDRVSDADTPVKASKKQGRKGRKAKEYGVSRGIDFYNVACVLNFDLPTTSKSYTHRIGRTARAGKMGMALSFVVPSELFNKHKSTMFPTARYDEKILEMISKDQEKSGKEVKPYHFDMKQVNAFRYRINDPLRAVTRLAIREARTRELRQELLKSEKLKRYFEENPEDLHHLRHDGELRAARVQPHLRHVPEYLLPSNGRKGIAGDDIGFVALRKPTDNRIRKARMRKSLKGKGKKATGRKSDPLKTFNAKGRR